LTSPIGADSSYYLGMASIEHVYRYARPSSLELSSHGQRLQLAAELKDGPSVGFFKGRLLEPEISAACLRTVSDLVGSRFYIPPSMLARILREADPVATVTDQKIRFEGFSACCSAYIRHDMDVACFEADNLWSGTTNVDFRSEMRAALSKVRAESPLTLAISNEGVELQQPNAHVVERRVPLPIRWIKGFAEVQTHLAGMAHKFSLPRVQAQRFLRDLPRAVTNHEQWVVPTSRGVRVSVRATPGSVMVKGSQRLRLFEKLAPKAAGLEVWFNESQGSSTWVLNFGKQRLLLTLNSEPWRGFSGDGSVLHALAAADGSAAAALGAQLNWQNHIDPVQIARLTGHTEAAISNALGVVAAQGLLGFDMHANSYFHRVLPFDSTLIRRLNPRLKSATKLYESGAVQRYSAEDANQDAGEGEQAIRFEVASAGAVHRVTLGEEHVCTCPWYAKHENQRGPCKHILAAEMALERPP